MEMMFVLFCSQISVNINTFLYLAILGSTRIARSEEGIMITFVILREKRDK